jgi:hypothetical protein
VSACLGLLGFSVNANRRKKKVFGRVGHITSHIFFFLLIVMDGKMFPIFIVASLSTFVVLTIVTGHFVLVFLIWGRNE